MPLAYSFRRLAKDGWTGKYSASNPPPKSRNFSNHPMVQVDKIVAELRRVGAANGERTPSQVALAWLIAKGAVPIPGAKNRQQAGLKRTPGRSVGAWASMTSRALDAVALYGQRGIAQRVWQHG